jgi:hypothetical protein
MAYSNSRFYGYDVDRLSIERARRKAAAQTEVTGRLSFEHIAAEELPFTDVRSSDVRRHIPPPLLHLLLLGVCEFPQRLESIVEP